MLVVVGGPPGVGKTTIAASLARRTGANFVRIDAIETGIARAALNPLLAFDAAGYQVGNQIVRSMLIERLNVIVDAVNPVAEARQGWIDLAGELDVELLLVEVTCSDVDLHKRRIEGRSPDLPGHKMPTWSDVAQLRYDPWPEADVRLDSANLNDDLIDAIATRLKQAHERMTLDN